MRKTGIILTAIASLSVLAACSGENEQISETRPNIVTEKVAVITETAPKMECVSEDRVRNVARHIPLLFEEVSPDVFQIRYVPESRNGTEKGGQLTVYLPFHDDSTFTTITSPVGYPQRDRAEMSIFDRTSPNPGEWYAIGNSSNTMNLNSDRIGCVDGGHLGSSIYINLTPEESLAKFNDFLTTVEDSIEARQERLGPLLFTLPL
jgi:hypothetical protein